MVVSQISSLTGRAQGLLAKMIEVAPIFQHAQFKLDASASLNVKDSDVFTNSAARAEGAAVQRDAQVPVNSLVTLALYGREVTIDDVRLADVNVGTSPEGLRRFADNRLKGLAVKMAEEIQQHMFTGTNASNQMLGLSEFVKDAASGGQTARLGFTAAELAAMNSNVSLQLNTTANQDAFVELLLKALGNVPGANAIVVNSNLGARLDTIGRRIGAAGETINSFGSRVSTFAGLPIVKVPVSAVTQGESDGTNSDCTSAWVLRFSEDLGTAWKTNSGFMFTDFENSEVTPGGIARMQFFLNLAVERGDALLRLSRIRL